MEARGRYTHPPTRKATSPKTTSAGHSSDSRPPGHRRLTTSSCSIKVYSFSSSTDLPSILHGKLLEHIVHDHLSPHIEENCLPNTINGFHLHFSTQDILFRLKEGMRKLTNRREYSILALKIQASSDDITNQAILQGHVTCINCAHLRNYVGAWACSFAQTSSRQYLRGPRMAQSSHHFSSTPPRSRPTASTEASIVQRTRWPSNSNIRDKEMPPGAWLRL